MATFKTRVNYKAKVIRKTHPELSKTLVKGKATLAVLKEMSKTIDKV